MSDKLSRLAERLSDLADHVEAIEIDRKQGRDSLEFDEQTRAWAATLLRTLAPVLAKCEGAMERAMDRLERSHVDGVAWLVCDNLRTALAALREVGNG